MTYHRFSNNESAINNRIGFGMFAPSESRVASGYGCNHFVYDGTNAISIADLESKFVEMYVEYMDVLPEYLQNMDPVEFYNTFNPVDIVDDAQAWDNADCRMFFNDYIYDEFDAIVLDDGAIVFNNELVCKL